MGGGSPKPAPAPGDFPQVRRAGPPWITAPIVLGPAPSPPRVLVTLVPSTKLARNLRVMPRVPDGSVATSVPEQRAARPGTGGATALDKHRVLKKHGNHRVFCIIRTARPRCDEGATRLREPVGTSRRFDAGGSIGSGGPSVGTGLRGTTQSFGRSVLKKVKPEIR